jgi:hypothetical protein
MKPGVENKVLGWYVNEVPEYSRKDECPWWYWYCNEVVEYYIDIVEKRADGCNENAPEVEAFLSFKLDENQSPKLNIAQQGYS